MSLSFGSFLHDQYGKVFGRPWPVIPSALVIAALSVFLFAFDRPWTASDGLRNWGDWLLQSLGIAIQADLLSPHLYSGSVLNLGLLVGSSATALLSREFCVRPAPFDEIIKGVAGGLLMGWGAMLAFGCNIGGFFSALAALSASGAGMMAGLLVGGFIGTRYLIRQNTQLISSGQLPFQSACQAAPRPAPAAAAFKLQPLAGVFVFLAILALGVFYHRLGHGRLAVFLSFGVAFGIIFQRSRFCLVNAFREPFMSGASEHARAAALALVLGTIGFTILKAADLKDASEWVFPSFWLGAMLGGVLFGLGMVLAGGCGAGSIWRAGEGQVKLWVALFCFAVGASMMRLALVRSDLIRQLGDAVFLPNVVGWAGAVWGVVALLIIWYLLASWTEQRKRAEILQF
ncbi:MAG: YeeE/YedE thiosulfate transporter family protein [Candidatus Binatia bacterium]